LHRQGQQIYDLIVASLLTLFSDSVWLAIRYVALPFLTVITECKGCVRLDSGCRHW